MKIIYKIVIPAFFLFAVLIIFISFFSRKIIEDALLNEEFLRVVKTSQSALHHEEYFVEESRVVEESLEVGTDSHTEEIVAESLLTPENFKDPLSEANQAIFRRYIQEFKDPSITKILLCANNFQILASSDPDLIGETSSDQQEITSIFSGKDAYFLKNVNNPNDKEHTSSDAHIDIFIPLEIEGKVYGVLEIQLKIDTILLPVRDQLNNIVFVFIIAGLVSFLGIYFITSYFIIRPIYYLQKKASEIASGNLENEISIKSKDEIGSLGRFFENMRQKLRLSVDNLKEFNRQLEIKVEEKTKELHSEQARLVSSIGSLPLGFIITDINKNIIMSNEAVKNIFLAKKAAISFDDLRTFLSSKHDLEENYIKCIKLKTPIIINSVDYENKILKISYFPVIENEVIGSVILFEDITDEKLLERNKEEFFAVASHELRTPLTAIRDNASLLQDFIGKIGNEKDIKEMSVDIYEASTGLLKLVNDILNISHLEQSKITFEKSSFDLSLLIKEVVNELSAHANQKSVQLFIVPNQETLPLAYTDKIRVKEVLYNLVGNALNFTEKGNVSIRVISEGNYLKCLVSDTGNGILPLNQNLLFRKFQQAGKDVITRDVSKGTGLGLYISRLLVEGLGGQIKLEESVMGKGSIFSFTIPISKD